MMKGTDLAREAEGGINIHADVIEAISQQLLIVFLKRLGGEISIPITEIDDTGNNIFSFRIDEQKVFHFKLGRKQ